MWDQYPNKWDFQKFKQDKEEYDNAYDSDNS
jgi:hypothetical protein